MLSRLKRQVDVLVEDVLASIPFFLLANAEAALISSPEPLEPGPSAGGVLLMHALHILTMQREIITDDVAEYMRRCLRWMDRWQGLGQAKGLADSRDLAPQPFVRDAHAIVWAGMAEWNNVPSEV